MYKRQVPLRLKTLELSGFLIQQPIPVIAYMIQRKLKLFHQNPPNFSSGLFYNFFKLFYGFLETYLGIHTLLKQAVDGVHVPNRLIQLGVAAALDVYKRQTLYYTRSWFRNDFPL